MLSIIIPTLNEEECLLTLLSSIKQQKFKDYEVIVADADSKDGTLELAEKYNCRTITGGLPAVSRNNGAKAARGDLFLFLDADVVLPEDFLEKSISEFKKRNIDIASCRITPLSKKKIDILLHSIVNFCLVIAQYFYPHAPGFCILTKKTVHNAINGFDEKLKLAEDHDYVNRAVKKNYKFRMLKNSRILVSVRRLETDGRFNIFIKYLFCEIYRIVVGEVKTNIFNYKFGHHHKNIKKQ